jgi:hypothetical protein
MLACKLIALERMRSGKGIQLPARTLDMDISLLVEERQHEGMNWEITQKRGSSSLKFIRWTKVNCKESIRTCKGWFNHEHSYLSEHMYGSCVIAKLWELGPHIITIAHDVLYVGGFGGYFVATKWQQGPSPINRISNKITSLCLLIRETTSCIN